MKTVICIAGKSCSGKDYLANKMSKLFNIPIVISYTTRPMRDYETNGVQHKFISQSEMDSIKPYAIAYTKINGYEYCTTMDCLYDKCIYIIDPKGIEYLRQFKDIDIKVIYVNTDMSVIESRAKNRSDYDRWKERIVEEEEMFRGWNEWDWEVRGREDKS